MPDPRKQLISPKLSAGMTSRTASKVAPRRRDWNPLISGYHPHQVPTTTTESTAGTASKVDQDWGLAPGLASLDRLPDSSPDLAPWHTSSMEATAKHNQDSGFDR